MPIRAVIFDLYGTLVPEFPHEDFYASIDHMAAVLGIDPERFREGWNGTVVQRQTGVYASMERNVVAICEAMGIDEPAAELVTSALERRAEMYRTWFRPREGAVETLTELRARGFRLALISMCAPDTPPMWNASAFAGLVDVEVFSSVVGLRKPDPAIYRYACDALDVEPGDCLYCGDGAYRELTGAAEFGMTAVEIRDPAVDVATLLHLEGDDWTGPRIGDLRELLQMV
ncbi:MAG: HAD family hydrolase [Actinomycetota bacterium]